MARPHRRAAGRAASRRAQRRRRPALLVAVGVGVVIAGAGVVAAVQGGALTSTPTAFDQVTSGTDGGPPGAGGERALRSPATADSTAIPRRNDVDPKSEKAAAYLGALREADIPTSRSGLPETEAAAVICEQLSAGADEGALVRSLPAVLPTVTKTQAATVVDAAQEHYCG